MYPRWWASCTHPTGLILVSTIIWIFVCPLHPVRADGIEVEALDIDSGFRSASYNHLEGITVEGVQEESPMSAIELSSKTNLKAGPDDDNEAEISAQYVKYTTKQGVCQVNGTQWTDYRFISGKFESSAVLLGDDTVGIGFYTKNIVNITSQAYKNHSQLVVKKRATTRCKSVLMWSFPDIIAPPEKKQRFKIDFNMDMGVVVNGSKTYNEMVYSTGYQTRLAIKHIIVEFHLPRAYKKKEIKIFGPNLVNETGSAYDAKKGVVKFERKVYLAPGNRYTVRVWFPVSKGTEACFACSRVGEWIMFVVLAPFVFCFLVPCCLHFLAKDASLASPGSAGYSSIPTTDVDDDAELPSRGAGDSQNMRDHFETAGVGRTLIS